MTFFEFSAHLAGIEKTASRLEMTERIAVLFQKLDVSEVRPACWLMLGGLGAKYEQLEFNFAEKMMLRALSEFVLVKKSSYTHQIGLLQDRTSSQESLSTVQSLFKSMGDMGTVASQLICESKKDPRTILSVYTDLVLLAKEHGEGSQDRKLRRMIQLIKQSNKETVKYIVRVVLGTLRLGFSDMTMLDALSWVKIGDKSLRSHLELAYQKNADIGRLAELFLQKGMDGLQSIEVELGIPVFPALCQRLKTADEMIEKMGKVIVEPKYDGTRVMIHVNKPGKDWIVRTFTRNLDETSGMFPELAHTSALSAISANTVILDSEAVGYDTKTGKLLAFQQTIQRKRKHDIHKTASRIPLRFFVFDVLFFEGKSLLRLPLHERKIILQSVLKNNDIFQKAPYIVTDDSDEIRLFHSKQLALGLEGAVLKQYKSEYQPGRRGWSWVKFKEEEGSAGKLSDTIDCIVMGYYKGQGKRTTFGMGAFLVGLLGIDERVYTIAKIGTGLSDGQWKELYARCSGIIVKTPPPQYMVKKELAPDVWVSPNIVVEIAADEITISPSHTVGVALRFPRLVTFRDDKNIFQATTMEELKKIV